MIVFTYLRNPKRVAFVKCRHCVTHKLCKDNQKCSAEQFSGENDVQLRKEKSHKKEKRQKKIA